MNLILLSDPDFISPTRVCLSGLRHTHIKEILKAKTGQQLNVGKINGLMGQGTVVNQKSNLIELDVLLDQKPPKPLALTLILALPRPPMFRHILFSAAMLGVKKIIVLNFNRVEKSFWNSSSLKSEAIEEQLMLGLQQAKDTTMPEVILEKKFKPFVEDQLPSLIKAKLAIVAHPQKIKKGSATFSEKKRLTPFFLILGPEGGIIDYELELLQKAGCKLLDLGPRILRTEYVLPLFVGRFSP